MVPTASASKTTRRAAVFMVLVMCSALLPLTAPVVSAEGRDASIMVTAIPNALEVNPGESGEYTIRVRNTGSNPVTVSLSTNEEATQECNAYTSTITQITGPIDAGSYEEASMNITLTQAAEGSCDTTVTVSATEQATPPDQPGAPAQESVTVTTTAGDGSGSTLFAVDVIIDERVGSADNKEQDWNGEEELDYRIEVENTGQSEASVNLTLAEGSGPGCEPASSFTVELDQTSFNLGAEDSEIVFATVEVPEGAADGKYCWEVTANVGNDPTQEASDTEEFVLNVPELRKCEVSLSKTSVSVNPDAETKITATYTNVGNTDWTVRAVVEGSKSAWVQVDGAASGLLPYDNGNGERAFDFIVSPDDSVSAGTEVVVNIGGKDGNAPVEDDCRAELRITVGQSRGASISAANAVLSNIEPGSNKSTTLTITNQGNGQDNLRVASSIAPTGWAVQLETSSVSVGSRHGNEKTANVGVTVRVPADALATEEIELVFSVLPSSGGTAYDTVSVRVTVAAVHALEIDTPATDQTGRSGTEVRFPIDLINEGNVRDTVGLSVVSQTASPRWGTSFETEDGMPMTEIDVDPQTTTTVYLVVSIDGEEELENSRITVRVRNKDDPNGQDRDGDGIPDNQRQGTFLAVLSDRNFSMDLRLENTDTATTGSIILPPSGQQTVGMWVKNTGDGNDDAVFTLGGLEGIATRSMLAGGLPVTDGLFVPKGYGIWSNLTESFVLDNETQEPLIETTYEGADNLRYTRSLVDNHVVREFEIFVELTLSVNPGAETGQGGLLEILVTSESNAADRSGLVTISLEVSIVHELAFMEAGERQELDIVYGQPAVTQEISIVNTGNIRSEIRVFASENLRGWSVILDSDNPDCRPENNDLICMVNEGETLYVNVTVRAPYGAEMEDTYKFTVSAEPTETGVLERQNIEFAAQGTPPEGVFGLSQTMVAQVAGLVLVALFIAALLNRRR